MSGKHYVVDENKSMVEGMSKAEIENGFDETETAYTNLVSQLREYINKKFNVVFMAKNYEKGLFDINTYLPKIDDRQYTSKDISAITIYSLRRYIDGGTWYTSPDEYAFTLNRSNKMNIRDGFSHVDYYMDSGNVYMSAITAQLPTQVAHYEQASVFDFNIRMMTYKMISGTLILVDDFTPWGDSPIYAGTNVDFKVSLW